MVDASEECSGRTYGKTYESDDDDVRIDLHAASSPDYRVGSRISHGIVISGEASESDDEIDSRPIPEIPTSGSDYSINESWSRQWGDGTETSKSFKDEHLKHNTLLHKKLRERNQCLRKSLIEMACQPYQSASKEIHCISQQLIKSQLLVQEVTSTLRRLTNELFELEDRVQSVKSGAFLPNIDANVIPHFDSP